MMMRKMALGVALVLVGVVLLLWNDNIGIFSPTSLMWGKQVVISVPNAPADFKNNSQLIHISGKPVNSVNLQDPLLGYSDKVIRMERQIEMFQWTQKEESKSETLPDGTERQIVTYTYKPEWSRDLIDSNGFKDAVAHRNPVNMPLNGLIGKASEVTVGDFRLSPELIEMIPSGEPVDLSTLDLTNIQTSAQKPVHHQGIYIMVGENPDQPAIGDVRIKMIATNPQMISVIAQQGDNMLRPLAVSGGQPMALVVLGDVSAKMMLGDGRKSMLMVWTIRVIALLMILIGVIALRMSKRGV